MTQQEKDHYVIPGIDHLLTTQQKAQRDFHIMEQAQKILKSKWSCREALWDFYYTNSDGTYTFIIKNIVTSKYKIKYQYFERKNADVITLD